MGGLYLKKHNSVMSGSQNSQDTVSPLYRMAEAKQNLLLLPGLRKGPGSSGIGTANHDR